jgi:hypothetical protein
LVITPPRVSIPNDSGHGLVRIDVTTRIAAEEVIDHFLDLGHAGLATDQDNIVDVRYRYVGVIQRHLEGLDGARDQVVDQGLELGTRDFQVQVLRS